MGIGRCITLNLKFKSRRGDPSITGIIILIIGLTIAAILIGSVLINGVGTLANSTTTNVCKNCDATTKALIPNVNIFIMIAVLLAIIAAGLAAFRIGSGGGRMFGR